VPVAHIPAFPSSPLLALNSILPQPGPAGICVSGRACRHEKRVSGTFRYSELRTCTFAGLPPFSDFWEISGIFHNILCCSVFLQTHEGEHFCRKQGITKESSEFLLEAVWAGGAAPVPLSRAPSSGSLASGLTRAGERCSCSALSQASDGRGAAGPCPASRLHTRVLAPTAATAVRPSEPARKVAETQNKSWYPAACARAFSSDQGKK